MTIDEATANVIFQNPSPDEVASVYLGHFGLLSALAQPNVVNKAAVATARVEKVELAILKENFGMRPRQHLEFHLYFFLHSDWPSMSKIMQKNTGKSAPANINTNTITSWSEVRFVNDVTAGGSVKFLLAV